MLTKAQRKVLAGKHKAQYLEVSNSWVCEHDRLLWPCPTAKVLYALHKEDMDRRAVNLANGKKKSA